MPQRDEYDDDRSDDRPRDDRRREDGYDDRGGQYDDYEQPPGDRREALVQRARERVSLPAIFLIITSLVCLAWAVAAIALLWLNPDLAVRGKYDAMKQFFPQQELPPYEEYVKQEQVQQSVVYSVRILFAILIFIGAVKMRNLQGYGLAMTASIIALIPACANECCCAFPFGLWAIIVLANQDVKRAFSIVAQGGAQG